MPDSFLFLVNPQNTTELVRFYFVWIVVLFIIHLIWDKCSSRSSNDSWKNIKDKVSELYSAATVSSSVLLGVILAFGFKKHPLFSTDAILIPLVLSVFTGVIVGFTGLVPKKTTAQSA
ncbi:hypothetical protein AB4508_20865 [Vibrio splendidus]